MKNSHINNSQAHTHAESSSKIVVGQQKKMKNYLLNKSVNMTLIDHKSKKKRRENIFPDERRLYLNILMIPSELFDTFELYRCSFTFHDRENKKE